MKLKNITALISVSLLAASIANAAVTEEQAKKLGTTLTAIGADPNPNKDGTIPAYTGGYTPPANLAIPANGIRPDPFASDKPVLTITAKNMDQYADKLTEGTKALLKKHADYKVIVYPTRRSVSLQKSILENTIKNATSAKTRDNGLGVENAYGGYPFPIPQNGNEAMWNHILRPLSGVSMEYKWVALFVDASGRQNLTSSGKSLIEYSLYDPKLKAGEVDEYARQLVTYDGPTRRVGEAVMGFEYLDTVNKSRKAYQYLPGQRRVRLAPDISFDTPNGSTGGVAVYDDSMLFSGSQERYDFKLVGKKEVYVPYNSYKLAYNKSIDDVMLPKFINPEVNRWELHRVWVVEANLKPGMRHVYKKRFFYFDEDSWTITASEAYDAQDQLYKVGYAYQAPSYDVKLPFGEAYSIHDLVSGNYTISTWPGPKNNGPIYRTEASPKKNWTPDVLNNISTR